MPEAFEQDYPLQQLKQVTKSLNSGQVTSHTLVNLYFVTFVPFGENPEWKSVYLCILSKK